MLITATLNNWEPEFFKWEISEKQKDKYSTLSVVDLPENKVTEMLQDQTDNWKSEVRKILDINY